MNAVAPEPVTNAELTRDLARAVHRPALLQCAVARAALGFGSGLATELLLASQRVLSGPSPRHGLRVRDPGSPERTRNATATGQGDRTQR